LFVINRELARATFLGDYERDGKRWQYFQIERSFLPSKVGKVDLVAPTLRFSSMRYNRGRLRGGQKDSFGIAGDPISLEVMPIPEVGRPSPYFAAVGRFSIEAALNRDRIRFGDSFKLTLTVRGQGNLEFLRMPDLSSLTGFHKRGAAEAVRDENRVVVTYDLTPLSADVAEIPPIAWNYFDTTPGVEAFIEVETKPLTVVVDAIENAETIASLPESAAAAVTPGVDDIFDLPAFDIAAIPNAEPSLLLRGLAVFSPWALMLCAFAWLRSRRLASLDVAGKRARGARRGFDAALERGDDAMDAIAAYLGDRVDIAPAAVISSDLVSRLGEHGLDEAVARDVASAIERGTAARYGGGQELTVDDARNLVQRLEGLRFGARCLLPFLLLSLVAFASTDLSAQEPEARRAYRAGEYQQADEAFERAYSNTQNRLYMRARGNCLYRLGDLARARWAYETARIAMPRDPELLANLQLVRTRLELLDGKGGLTGELRRLMDRYTLSERTAVCMVCMLLAAGCLIFGFHRLGWRWLGIACLSAGLLLALDILWLTPGRPIQGVVLRNVPVTAEPRTDMEAVALIRPGAIVDLLGGRGGEYLRVDASGRSGYVAADAIAVVE
jgi:tetratricopeptide (TPR) repeat protein